MWLRHWWYSLSKCIGILIPGLSNLSGQVSFFWQLHLGWSSVFFSDRILFLYDFIMLPKLGKQLELTLTLFLLNILWNLLVFRKCLSIRFRKVFPMFVSTLTLYGGLNHIVFLCLTFFEGVNSCWWVRFSLYPLAVSASFYEGAALLSVALSD